MKNLGFSFFEIGSAFVVLFGIIDALGSIPIILSIKQKEPINAGRTVNVALAILLIFFFAGEWMLNFLGVDIKSFAVAGALILFLMALEMLLDIEIFKNKGPEGSASIIPLAFPLIAGPGTFAVLISLQSMYHSINIVIALLLNMLWVYIVIKSTDKIEKLIGEGGIYILRKFFGLILLAMSVKMFTTNLSQLVSLVKKTFVNPQEQIAQISDSIAAEVQDSIGIDSINTIIDTITK